MSSTGNNSKGKGSGSGRGSGAGRGAGKGNPSGGGASHRKGRPSPGRTARQPAEQFTPPREKPKTPVDQHVPDGERLQKVMAAAGVGSRRVCEDLIAAGRVEVDGHKVIELGIRIDPERQTVHVDGERIQFDSDKIYIAFNKPTGVVSTMNDELGRPSVGEYVIHRKERLFHVGRLDVDTEGLLLLTNDGELANRLQHPSYGVTKTYVAVVPGPVPRALGRQLREGVELEDGIVKVDSFKVVDSRPGWSMVEIVLHEGRNHIVRRLLEESGHPVESLVRTDVGPVQLGELRPGKLRPLTTKEIAGLYKAAGL